MGNLLNVLKASPVLAALSPAELQAVANASRRVTCDLGRPFFVGADAKEETYVLEEGQVAVWVHLRPGERCGGQTTAIMDHAGQTFGWSALVREDRLTGRARCVARTRLIVVALRNLASPIRLKMLRRLATYLFALLQELGLCPFNLAGLLTLSKTSRG